MSMFNKLFTGSVLAATLLVVIHTGAWAWSASRALDRAQAAVVAPVIAMAANASAGSPATTATDSCAQSAHVASR